MRARRYFILSMFPRPAVACALLIACACGPRQRGPEVLYRVRVLPPPVKRAEIQASITRLSPRHNTLSLAMVERYAYVMLDRPLLGGEIEARDDAGRSLSVVRDDPYHWTVAKGKSRGVTLSYTVPIIHKSLPEVAGRDEYEQPFVETDHGLLVTGTLFVAPDRTAPADYRVRFETPPGWDLHCPWDEVEPGLFAPATLGALWDDLVAIGDWHMRETTRGGMLLSIAVAPGQERLEQSVAPFVAEIMGAEIELFGRAPRSKYLVLFVNPLETQMAGSPKTGSITMAVPLNDRFSLAEMSHLIAHEFHHTWLYSICELPDELRFYNEGFTDYFAFLTCARLGIMSWDRFGIEMGAKMDACGGNLAAARYSLAEAGGGPFFEDPAAENLTYAGGGLLAALLDLEIRAAHPERKLDHFARDFNNDARWSWSAPPDLDDFLAAIASELDAEAAERYARWIRAPWNFDPVAEFGPWGVDLSVSEPDALASPRADIEGNRILRIDPAGPAGKLGLRRGDLILSLNGESVGRPEDLYRLIAAGSPGKLAFVLERDGRQVAINAPWPREIQFSVAASPWREGF